MSHPAVATVEEPAVRNRSALVSATECLLRYCQESHWAGYDPYDALNSRLLRHTPLGRSKLIRLGLTQLLKRSPINLRPLLLVPPSSNSKGLALFIGALLKLQKVGLANLDEVISAMLAQLMQLRSDRYSYDCWGYGFDWQTRTDLVPGRVPNIICTTFVANALLDLHAERADPQLLRMATSAAHFVRDVLLTRGEDGELWFSYTPVAPSQVHNANLLGAALLARVGALQSNDELIQTALQATRFTVRRQHPDGAWDYGERDQPSQRWKDNFHTGFNLCALRAVERWADTVEFQSALRLGWEYYCAHFFSAGGAPKYFHDRVYPIDVHSIAQSLITLTSLRDLSPESDQLRDRVVGWTLDNMWDKSSGFFYYQKWPFLTVRIPYIRWGQAWMLAALATILETSATLPTPSGGC